MDLGKSSAVVKFPGQSGGGASDGSNGNGKGSENKEKSRSKAIEKVHSLDPKLAGLANSYFSINLTDLHETSDEDLAAYADRAEDMTRLMEALPILEKHFKTLIEGQVAYEQFVTNVQKEVAKAAKAIDKNILDTWLLSKGYEQHIKVMGEKARVGLLSLETETENAIQLTQLDHSMAMRVVAIRHKDRTQEIEGRLPVAQARQSIAETKRKERQDRKNLLTYGTKSNQGNEQGPIGKFWNWATGQ